MVTIETRTIDNIPVLHAFETGKENEKLPLMLFIHGFTSAKEHNLHFAYALAQKGYRVVLPDMLHHGERMSDVSGDKRMYSFWDIVVQGIQDIHTLVQSLDREGIIDPKRVGVSGTSMGGIITFGALSQYPYIKAAVTLMGTPYYEDFAYWQIEKMKQQEVSFPFSEEALAKVISIIKPFDLTSCMEKLDNRPLLLWHSKIDEVVPFSQSCDFYRKAKAVYKNPEKIQYIADETSGHKVSRTAYLETVKWFAKYL
ncbi:esterase [Fictibacillus sp. WQ 8-8]|uniref:esterase n=1 Tax=unclassified Fictibacillus TaxID=2644029 RepID=UPI00210AE6DF|nr:MULTISPECIES: esterase [unclassified Fictibacillus]MCQ6265507.1 esterase [Fictibacillus sp. WQ 8-8]MED2973593.1 esterase [Fictibacillus sp. B-59209]